MIGIIITLILDGLLLFFLIRRNKDYPFGLDDYAVLTVVALVSLFLSGRLNGFFGDILLKFFDGKYCYIEGELYWYSRKSELLHDFIKYFFIVAVVEETTKHIVLFFQLRRKQVRTYLDCIISFLIVSVIFSVVEDIEYFIYKDAQYRFITEISGHLMFSMIVGECYYKYMVNKKMINLHSFLVDKGVVDKNTHIKPKYISIFIRGFLTAIFLHGLYNFCISLSGIIFILCLISYAILFCFKYKKALNNKLISVSAVEKYEKLQLQVTKEEIFSLIMNSNKDE